MFMKNTNNVAAYQSPKVDFLLVESEGVLCESTGGSHVSFTEEDTIIF